MEAADWNHRPGFGWWWFGEVRKLFGVALQIFKKALELALHRVHLFAHVQNDFNAGQVDDEVARQRQNNFQTLKIRVRVKTGIAFGPRRLQQSLALVQAEGLRMQLKLLGHSADGVGFSSAFHKNKRWSLDFDPWSLMCCRKSL